MGCVVNSTFEQMIADENYCLKIDFDKEKDSPVAALVALGEFAAGLEKFDKIMAEHLIGSDIIPSLVLENIQAGSIWTFFTNVLRNTDDSEIKEKGHWAFYNQFLIELKHAILGWIDQKQKISSVNDIREIEAIVIEVVKKYEARPLADYHIEEAKLMDAIDALASPIYALPKAQKVTLISKNQTSEFSHQYSLSRTKIEEGLVETTSTTNVLKYMRIKKPDYLGESKWELRDENNDRLDAKILDEKWLNDFHQEKLPKFPGPTSVLKVRGHIIQKFDKKGRKVAEELEIISVEDVIQEPDPHSNTDLFEPPSK